MVIYDRPIEESCASYILTRATTYIPRISSPNKNVATRLFYAAACMFKILFCGDFEIFKGIKITLRRKKMSAMNIMKALKTIEKR